MSAWALNLRPALVYLAHSLVSSFRIVPLAPPFPSSFAFQHHICSKFTKWRHRFGVNASLVRYTMTCTTGVVNRQSARRAKWDSDGTNAVAGAASMLQACKNMKEVEQVHAQMLGSGLNQNIFVITKLVGLYAMCCRMDNARLVFENVCRPDVVLWNVMIRGYVRIGQFEEALRLFYQMQLAGIQPDKFTFPCILTACADLLALQEGKVIHGFVLRIGFESDTFVGNSLVAMYAKCGHVDLARQLFDKMPEKDVVSWNAMIVGCAQNGHANEALALFDKMQLAGMAPDPFTMVSVLTACARLGNFQQGRRVHDYIIGSNFRSNVFVDTALVDMYAKFGSLEIARSLFDKMPERNVVSWNAMIAGYAQNGQANEALALFEKMTLADSKPNPVTVGIALQACACLRDLEKGKWIHDFITRNGFELHVFVGTSLIDMYAKCGRILIARHLFDKMSERNVVSWNAMIAGYVQNGHANEALTLFDQMNLVDMKPSAATIVSVLPACASLAALQQGKWIHGCIVRSGFDLEVSVGNCLIDMYAKCGSIDIAHKLFDRMTERDVVSWSAMIAGYGMHGHGKEAIALFSQMQQTGTNPNHVTFVSVLYACSHAGLVGEGWQYFDCMSRDYCITPSVEHYACMVDLLGRAGHLDEAVHLIKKMPLKPDVGVWGALLGGCRIHCNVQLGEHAAECLLDLEPENPGIYVLLSNTYSAARRWDDAAKVRTIMNERRLKKTAGCSLIEVNHRLHAFLAGDKSHPQSDKIYAMLKALDRQMKKAGYVPNTNFVLHDVEEKVKESMLYSHSEKLAIVFGLINTRPGTPIRITKNLRVCGDCHNATKFMSQIVMREIIVRDANRFHHFKDGRCSCGDYW